MVAEVFAPIGGIGDPHSATENGTDILCQRHQPFHERKRVARISHAGETGHLRTDDEPVDAPRHGSEMGVVQDVAAESPVVRIAGEGHRIATMDELRCSGRSQECLDLRPRCPRPVRAARPAGSRITGDPTAPGIRRLRHVAVGIRKPVVLRHVHHDERIKGDLETARLERPYRVDDSPVGGSSSVGGPAVVLRDGLRLGPGQAGHAPRQ